jgi:hypothetical protein
MNELTKSVRTTETLTGNIGDYMYDSPMKRAHYCGPKSHERLASALLGKVRDVKTGPLAGKQTKVVGLETIVTKTAMSPLAQLRQHVVVL